MILLTLGIASGQDYEAPGNEVCRTAAGHLAEGKLESFLGETKLDIQQVHKGGRFPNVLVAVDGTALVFWGGVKVRRSEDGDTFIVQTSPEFKVLARNALNEMCMATPTTLRENIIIRTLTKLYRIGR
jgi:hypothetical protein